MSSISEETLSNLLAAEHCGPEFINEALRFKRFYGGDIDAFIEKVETILSALEEEDNLPINTDDDDYNEGFEDDLDDYDHYDDMNEEADQEDEDDEERY